MENVGEGGVSKTSGVLEVVAAIEAPLADKAGPADATSLAGLLHLQQTKTSSKFQINKKSKNNFL